MIDRMKSPQLTLRKGYILLVVALLMAFAVRYMTREHLLATPSSLSAMASAAVSMFALYYLSGFLTVRRTRYFIGPTLLFLGLCYGYAQGEAVFPLAVLWAALLFAAIESYVRADVQVSD